MINEVIVSSLKIEMYAVNTNAIAYMPHETSACSYSHNMARNIGRAGLGQVESAGHIYYY